MATFKDKTGQDWTVSLDPVIADEIKQDHGIELTNLANDPLLKLRTEPAVLYAVILVICREQMEQRNLTREQFLKRLPMPPDSILTGIEEGITSFFPTGRHSHVREVLASYANMGSKTDELITAKMQSVMDDPRVMRAMDEKFDKEIGKAMQTLIDSPAGT